MSCIDILEHQDLQVVQLVHVHLVILALLGFQGHHPHHQLHHYPENRGVYDMNMQGVLFRGVAHRRSRWPLWPRKTRGTSLSLMKIKICFVDPFT